MLRLVSSNVPPERCRVCRQRRDPARARETTIRAAFCGVLKYGQCPACLREVLPPWPADYKKRWTTRARERRRFGSR